MRNDGHCSLKLGTDIMTPHITLPSLSVGQAVYVRVRLFEVCGSPKGTRSVWPAADVRARRGAQSVGPAADRQQCPAGLSPEPPIAD